MWSDRLLDLGTDFLVSYMVLHSLTRRCVVCCGSTMARILLWSSAVRVHDSQAYRKMDATRERISHILELREILPSFQTGYNLVNAAVVRAIPESISGFGTLIRRTITSTKTC